MTTDRELEDFLKQVRLGTTAEQDERILGDALAAIAPSAVERPSAPPATATGNVAAPTGQPADSPLRTLSRRLRQHWRLSMAAACVLALLAVLPQMLPQTEAPDSGAADKVAAVPQSPENIDPPTLGTKGAGTEYSGLGLAVTPEAVAAGTRGVLRKGSATPNARGADRQTKSPAAAVAPGDKGGTFRTERPALRREDLAGTVRPAARGTSAGEAAWGEAVDGVQVRLRAKQRKWEQGASIRLSADVRNQGKRNLLVRTRDHGLELEVDGRWYLQPMYAGTIGPPKPLPPGRRYDDIAVVWSRSWLFAAPRKARAPWKAGPEKLGDLTPGKHTIRVAFAVTAAKGPSGKPLKPVSNPVEIEIVAKNDGKADATQQGKAGATPAKPTVQAPAPKPGDRAPAGETAWGKAVEGVQVRLRAKQRKWKQGTVVRLQADVRNQGKRNLSVTTIPNGCELEVDGRWYRRPIGLGLIVLSPLTPGGRHEDIAISLDRSWWSAAPQKAHAPWKAAPGTLGELAPGKHTLRVGFTVVAARNAPVGSFKVVSNPVEIEIVAKKDGKADATQQGSPSTTAGKPDDPTTTGRPVEPPPRSKRPDRDTESEKEAVFDMEKVSPASEPKLRAVIGPYPASAVARKGEIEISGRRYTALLARLGTTTQAFDRPDTLLLLTAADNPKHRIQSYEMHLGSVRTVDGKYYKISATPTGDKLTVTPCGDNVGVLQIGAGGRDIDKPMVNGGVLISKDGMVPLGNYYYPVPAEDPAQRRIPVGDYAPKYLYGSFGNVHVSLRPNGPPAFDVKIRKDKPSTINFSAKGELRLTSPRPTKRFKPGSSVPFTAVIVDPELDLQVSVWDATRKVSKRTYTYSQGRKYTTTSCSIALNPTFVIRNSSGKQVATGKLPFC